MNTNRVVITGLSLISPLGLDLETNWQSLIAGKSGIQKISKFDTTNFDVKIAGEVVGFNPDLYVPKKEQKKMDLFIQYSLACAQQALKHSGLISDSSLHIEEKTALRTGCLIGVGIGGLPQIEEADYRLAEKGPGRMSPFFIPMVISNLASGQVSIAHNIKGANYSVTSACASGAHSVGEAFRMIRDGLADVMLAGGSESAVCGLAIGGFAAMRALSSRSDDPTKASRPFDKDRDGFVLAEGASLLVLENYEHAKARGANILAEVIGYGFSSDAYHMTNPAPGGDGARRAIEMALNFARINPEKIDYINAHGTSTPVGDEVETQAIKEVFKDHAKNLSVSSTKSMMGHTLGAAGAIETTICVKALLTNTMPPTINLENPSDICDLDYVPHTAKERKLNYVLNNSFGFGGTNACLVLAKI